MIDGIEGHNLSKTGNFPSLLIKIAENNLTRGELTNNKAISFNMTNLFRLQIEQRTGAFVYFFQLVIRIGHLLIR